MLDYRSVCCTIALARYGLPTMNSAQQLFDRALLRKRRTRAADSLAHHDFLLDRSAQDFAERLSAIQREFAICAVVGAHTGRVAERLSRLPKVGTLVQTESIMALAQRLIRPSVVCDEETLPFADQSLDLIASALSLQLVNDLPGVLAQMRRALTPDGLLLVSILGGDTLCELREAFMTAEAEIEGGASPRVAPFGDVRELGALLQRAGLALPVADRDIATVSYATPIALMAELRAMGAGNVLFDRKRSMLKRTTLMRACEIYSERHGDARGRVTATFEIITLTAWAPHESQQKPLAPGTADTRLASALGATEYSAGEKASFGVKPVGDKKRAG